MRVLVCGGRDYQDVVQVNLVLDTFHALHTITGLCHGGARGADSLAGRWAAKNKIPRAVYPANWKEHGKAAGPIRNAFMLEAYKPDLVIAFPGGSGTAHMVKLAERAQVRVVRQGLGVEVHADTEEPQDSQHHEHY
jgi:hypothetical protein